LLGDMVILSLTVEGTVFQLALLFYIPTSKCMRIPVSSNVKKLYFVFCIITKYTVLVIA
jgi:hypothetical protein